MTDDLTPVPSSRRVYRLSALGECTTALAARGQGIQPQGMPEKLHPALEAGKRLESVILAAAYEDRKLRPVTMPEMATLREHGLIAGFEARENQVQVAMSIGSEAEIRGHLDALTRAIDGHPHDLIIVEAKAFGDDLWKKWMNQGIDAFPHYAWQLSGQMACVNAPAIMAIGHKNEDGSDVTEVGCWYFDTPPYSKGAIIKRVLEADSWAKQGILPDCTENRWPCAYSFLPQHIVPEKVAPVPTVVLFDEELGEACRDFDNAKAIVKIEEARQKKNREVIARRWQEQGLKPGELIQVTDMKGGTWNIGWVHQDIPAGTRKASVRSYPTVDKATEESNGHEGSD